jgi:hypothetical protein
MYTNIDICNPNKLLFITICTLSGILVAIYFDESRRQISENFGESHHCKNVNFENFGESHHCKDLKLENFGESHHCKDLKLENFGESHHCKDLKLENFGESHHCKNLKLENFGGFQLTMVSPGLIKTSCKDLCIIMIML